MACILQKRALIREHKYYFASIAGTPFSLAIVLPEPYGSQEIAGRIEVKRKDENYTNYFKGNNWRVHPDWIYCQHSLEDIKFNTSEDVIRHFLKLVNDNDNDENIHWKVSGKRPLVYQKLTCKLLDLFCFMFIQLLILFFSITGDRLLVESLVFDAKATFIDAKNCGAPQMSSNIE